jgi:hypothetical protein
VLWARNIVELLADGGRLKLGYGPGGPPVISTEQLRTLLKKVEQLAAMGVELPITFNSTASTCPSCATGRWSMSRWLQNE